MVKMINTVTKPFMPVLVGHPEVMYHAGTCYHKVNSRWEMDFIAAKNLDALKKVELI